MSLVQTLYFMSLVGGMAGLFSWALTSLLSAIFSQQPGTFASDLVATTVLGGFIGAFTVAFSDRWSGNRVVPRWIASGTLIGLSAGFIAGLVQIPLTNALALNAPQLSRVLAWMLAGSFIGIGLGLRWIHMNHARVVHGGAGGLVGGMLGGVAFVALAPIVPALSQALGFVMVGVGICFGVTVAPILLRAATLQFVSSGDARAQSKLARPHKEWEIQQGDSYVIGSRSPDFAVSRYRPDIDIYLPDKAVAPRHAILFGKAGRFYLARHPDAADRGSLAKFELRVRGQSVTTSVELRDDDDIRVGRTALRFGRGKEK